jgi:hypothetical protein
MMGDLGVILGLPPYLTGCLQDTLVTWPGAPKLVSGAPKTLSGALKTFSGALKSFQGLPSQELIWRGLYQVILKMRPAFKGNLRRLGAPDPLKGVPRGSSDLKVPRGSMGLLGAPTLEVLRGKPNEVHRQGENLL